MLMSDVGTDYVARRLQQSLESVPLPVTNTIDGGHSNAATAPEAFDDD